MAVLTISAVDNTTEKLTITAHGLTTGDGPVAIFTPSGSGAGVIPTGLAAVTDYWVIVVDANNIKLATSSANALAGTAINITSNGTLPLYLLVGLPFRRPRTYVAGSQIKSVDLNAIADDQVALWNLLTGQAQSIFTPDKLAALFAHGPQQRFTHASGGVGNMTYSVSGFCAQASAGAQSWQIPIKLSPGDRIRKEIGTGVGSFALFTQPGAGTITWKIWEVDLTTPGTFALISTNTHAGGGGAFTIGTFIGGAGVTDIGSGAGSGYIVQQGKGYFFEFLSGANGDLFYGMNLAWDRTV